VSYGFTRTVTKATPEVPVVVKTVTLAAKVPGAE
jgi:hypothetical protein